MNSHSLELGVFNENSINQRSSDYLFPIRGKSIRMFGIGGQSELCYQQAVSNLFIDHLHLQNFTIQLGITKESYGFEAILGLDIMLHFGFKIDFVNLEVLYNL